MSTKYVKYLRVSTKGQFNSGLGLDAQSDIIDYFIRDGEVLKTFTEAYSGTDLKGCKELQKAIKYCKENEAKLILYKSDRFRNVDDALSVMAELGEGNLVTCDLPNADRFTFILFFAIAEREALLISLRTKNALNQIRKEIASTGQHVSKAGNVVTSLGRAKGSPGVSTRDAVNAAFKAKIGNDPNRRRQFLTIKSLHDRGDTLASITATLNATEEPAPRGGRWSIGMISRALNDWPKYFLS